MNYEHLTSVEIEGIDFADAPDFVNAFVVYAEYEGVPLTEAELETLNEDHPALVYEYIIDYIY